MRIAIARNVDLDRTAERHAVDRDRIIAPRFRGFDASAHGMSA